MLYTLTSGTNTCECTPRSTSINSKRQLNRVCVLSRSGQSVWLSFRVCPKQPYDVYYRLQIETATFIYSHIILTGSTKFVLSSLLSSSLLSWSLLCIFFCVCCTQSYHFTHTPTSRNEFIRYSAVIKQIWTGIVCRSRFGRCVIDFEIELFVIHQSEKSVETVSFSVITQSVSVKNFHQLCKCVWFWFRFMGQTSYWVNNIGWKPDGRNNNYEIKYNAA